MSRLVARGPELNERRCRLRPDRPVRLGRQPTKDDRSDSELFAIPWESSLSRNHVDLRWVKGRLEIARVDGATNPLFFKGIEQDRFVMELGEHFVVGETTFSLVEDRVSVAHDDLTPLDVVGYTMAELAETRYGDADERIELLATLPDVIRRASNDEELFARLVLLLFEGIAIADAAAIVRVVGDDKTIQVFYWDSRKATTTELKPSRKLILDAVEDRRQSVRSLWGANASSGSSEYTMTDTLDWAFVTPVPGKACAGWGIYVAGKAGEARIDLRPDVKFTELVADLLGAMRDFQALERQQVTLGRFFSPVTLPILSSPDGEDALAPRETDVTVLFCDLRGFSREAERSKDDLMGLLHRVSHALDVMTKCIHSHHGVIGDFQGDAALAFWGWPLDDGNSALEACLAAVEIRERFADAAEKEDDPLSGFQCGVGIASGDAVAGRLGTAGQFKIDVFGPVVNLAARLEGITKMVRVPLLVDEATAQRVRENASGGDVRFRRLARIRPYGMDLAVTVSELLPSAERAGVLTAEGVTRYETALDDFIGGNWDAAFEGLHDVPHWDHGKDFLIAFILKHQRKPPTGWDGVVPMDSK